MYESQNKKMNKILDEEKDDKKNKICYDIMEIYNNYIDTDNFEINLFKIKPIILNMLINSLIFKEKTKKYEYISKEILYNFPVIEYSIILQNNKKSIMINFNDDSNSNKFFKHSVNNLLIINKGLNNKFKNNNNLIFSSLSNFIKYYNRMDTSTIIIELSNNVEIINLKNINIFKNQQFGDDIPKLGLATLTFRIKTFYKKKEIYHKLELVKFYYNI
jgi:hypothetical protein